MSRPIEALAEEVLQLLPEARTKLLDRVVASLDTDRARDAAWDKLASDREAGAADDEYVPVTETLARLRAVLK